jgi:hypothetical protein
VRIADNPQLLQTLKASLLDLQLKKTQLLTKFEPNHRLVQEVDQQIEQAKAAIAAENLLPLRDETTDRNEHYEWAKSELQQAQVRLKALEARERIAVLEKKRASESRLPNFTLGGYWAYQGLSLERRRGLGRTQLLKTICRPAKKPRRKLTCVM